MADQLDRVLVVKLADMGDAILATSAIGALRQTYPYARLDVLTAGAGASIFHLCDSVDDVITLDKQAFDHPTGLLNPRSAASLLALTARLRFRRYDAIVLMHHLTTDFGAKKFSWLCTAIGAPIRAGLDNGRGTFLTRRATDYGFGFKSVHDYGLDVVALLGADVEGARPHISIPAEADRQVDHLLQAAGIRNEFIAIHPSVGGYATARNWFHDRFTAVARSIREELSVPVVLVGADDASERRAANCARITVDQLGGANIDSTARVARPASASGDWRRQWCCAPCGCTRCTHDCHIWAVES